MYLSHRHLFIAKKLYIVVKSHLGRAALIEAGKMDVVPIGCSVNLKVFSLYRTEAVVNVSVRKSLMLVGRRVFRSRSVWVSSSILLASSKRAAVISFAYLSFLALSLRVEVPEAACR